TLFELAELWLDEPDSPFILLTADLERCIAHDEAGPAREPYARALAHDLSVQLGHRVGKELAERPAVGIATAEWARNLRRSLEDMSIQDMAGMHVAELCRRIAHESRPDLGRPWANAIVGALSERGVDVAAPDPMWIDFGLVESHS